MGMALGALLSMSNVYVGLKSGWSLGVSITASVLAYGAFAALHRAFPRRFPAFGVLENNAMQSCASAAGYMTGAGLVNAIPALMMLNPSAVPGRWPLTLWMLAISWLGVFLAVPAKRQLVNAERLPFPSGTAAAATLRALHGDKSRGARQARALLWSSGIGAIVAWWRDAVAAWLPYPNLPATWGTSWIWIGRHRLSELTMSFEGSLLFVASGAIMGWKQAWSMMLGATVNFVVLAPWMMSLGVIPETGGSAYRRITSWSLWIGVPMLVTSGLLLFALQWRTVLRAFSGLASLVRGRPVDDPVAHLEVPGSWVALGILGFGGVSVVLAHRYFAVAWWMGAIAVLFSLFLVLVAARATGETDITPVGALSKITQLSFGAIRPGDVTSNLMTANVTAGATTNAGDLLIDLKCGYLLGANPRKQFVAHLFGVLAAGLTIVPVYFLIVPDASVLGTEKWPAPAAQQWRAVAELLSHGVTALHPTARVGLVAGAALGLALPLLERALPARARAWVPAPTGLGLAFTLNGFNSVSMFLGALLVLVLARRAPRVHEEYTLPVASGLIAGESLMGVLVALLVVAGLLSP
jgi:uncharacterized oligopeptide transporter (OPT) family protein